MCQNISLSRRGVLLAHLLFELWVYLYIGITSLCLYYSTKNMNIQDVNLHKDETFNLCKTQIYIFWA